MLQIQSQKEQGILVSYHDFEDSGHVAHFKRHAEEYEKLVFDFFHTCTQLEKQKVGS